MPHLATAARPAAGGHVRRRHGIALALSSAAGRGCAPAQPTIEREESIMKKLFGVMMLAALPVACGTDLTSPTAPSQGAPAAEEAFAASGRIAATCSDRADWSSVRGVVVNVMRSGKDSATLRADLLILGDTRPLPCYTPVFSVKPSGRGIQLQPERDRREVTLRGPEGLYSVAALVEGPQKPGYTASVMVALPAGK
jgi:hypothetical protein